MISSKDYIALFKQLQYLGRHGIFFADSMIEELDILRKLDKKYTNEMETLHFYRRHKLDKAIEHAKQIMEICKENQIDAIFEELIDATPLNAEQKEYKVSEEAFTFETHINYKYKGRTITGLINAGYGRDR